MKLAADVKKHSFKHRLRRFADKMRGLCSAPDRAIQFCGHRLHRRFHTLVRRRGHRKARQGCVDWVTLSQETETERGTDRGSTV
jgi:hypothetical protein